MAKQQYIYPERLYPYVGSNPAIIQSLIQLFATELSRFKEQLMLEPDNDQHLAFRKAHHSISPTLQMFQLQELENLIVRYKKSTDPLEAKTGQEKTDFNSLQTMLQDIINELKSLES